MTIKNVFIKLNHLFSSLFGLAPRLFLRLLRGWLDRQRRLVCLHRAGARLGGRERQCGNKLAEDLVCFDWHCVAVKKKNYER